MLANIAGLTITGFAMWKFFELNKSKISQDKDKIFKKSAEDINKTISRNKDLKNKIENQKVSCDDLLRMPTENKKTVESLDKNQVKKISILENLSSKKNPVTSTSVSIPNNHLKSPHEIVNSIEDKIILDKEIYQNPISKKSQKIRENIISKSKKLIKKAKKIENINVVTKLTSADLKYDLCKRAFDEFKVNGYSIDINPKTKDKSYNISRQPDGKWFKCIKLSRHALSERIYLNLGKMSALKDLTDNIDEARPEITIKGGRIFITERQVYRIKKGIKYPIDLMPMAKTNKASLKRFQKVCNELIECGHVRDCYRSEETYIISKSTKGIWFVSVKHTSYKGKEIFFQLSEMPNLRMLANKINKQDPIFEVNGGRIFITPTRVFRIKNKIEYDYEFEFKN